MAPGQTPLHRSRSNRIIAGVCGGFARWLGWSPTTFRVLYVILSVLSAAFPGILVYLVLWLVMPNDPASPETHQLKNQFPPISVNTSTTRSL